MMAVFHGLKFLCHFFRFFACVDQRLDTTVAGDDVDAFEMRVYRFIIGLRERVDRSFERGGTDLIVLRPIDRIGEGDIVSFAIVFEN